MFGYLVTLCLTVTLLSYSKGSNISDQRLCFDPECNEPLSRARTLMKYVKGYDGGLSFQPGAEVVIYSKSAGTRPDLWGAEVGGKRGYIPKNLVKEYKVFHPDSTLKYTVPTSPSDEAKQRESEFDKQEGSAETTLEKQLDVSVNEKPATINSESRVDKKYDVIDGTTFYDDTIGLATPTLNQLDATSMGISGVPIESTTSFTATSDLSPATMTQSDMAPISPTTMMEKSENQDASAETVGKSEEVAGMVESVFNMMSDLVSGGEEDISNENSIEDKKGIDGTVSAIDKLASEALEAGSDNNVKSSDKVDDLKSTDVHESMDDEDEDDDVEDEEDEGGDEEDDEDDDDEENVEPVMTGEERENITVEIDEHIPDMRGEGDDLSKEERKSEIATLRNESELAVEVLTHPGFQSSPESSVSGLTDVDDGPTLEKGELLNSIGEVTDETHVPSHTSSHFNDSSSSLVAELGTQSSGLEKPRNFHHRSDGSRVDFESLLQVEDVSYSGPRDDANHEQHNENDLPTVSGDILPASSERNQEPQVEALASSDAHVQDKSESLISGDQNVDFSVTGEITTESSYTTVSPAGFGDQYAKPMVQTEPSNVVSDVYNSDPGQSDVKPMVARDTEDVTAQDAAFMDQHDVPSTQIEPSNLVSDEYESSPEPTNVNTLEAKKTEEVTADKPKSHSENDDNVVLDESSGLKESESPEDDVVLESPNVSDIENMLPVSEDSSSGIFSALFDSLGSGYGIVSSMIFGGGDERIEVMESQESSTQGVSHIAASKYSDSEHNPYQHNPIEDVQNLAAEGESVIGRSLNSYCEGSSERDCSVQSSALPSKAESSSDSVNQIFEENQESSSWMAFPNFSIGNDSSGMFNFHVPSYGAMIYSIITGIIVLCFFLGHYFIEGNRRDVVLLAKINALEKELTVSSKECLILKEKLKQFEIKSSDFDDSAEVINAMKNELEKVQSEKAQLEKELEATTEAGLEMEHMVSQFLSSQHDSKSLMESIEQLQMQANKQQAKISSLENSLVAKTQENEKLAQELGVTESKVQELEEDLKQVSENLCQRDEEHSKRYAELKELSEIQHNKYLEDVKNKTIETEMAHTRCKSLEATLTEMKEMLAVKENEICVLQECLQQLKISNGDDPDKAEDQLKDILNFGKLKAELTAVSKERDNLKEKLQGEEDARRLLEDHVKVIREEVEKLRKCHEAAEREKVEAQTRLEVLSSYFKEKESQLQKELGNKEALWIQKHTDASTIMQRMKSLEEEVENYKKEDTISKPSVSERVTLIEAREITITHPSKEWSQNETLKKEILDQERGYKTQLATIEKKAHENWVAARQAERKLEESKQEASQLRNRLTMADKTNPISTSQNGDDSKPNINIEPTARNHHRCSTDKGMIDSNGELSASPLHLGLASNSSVDMLLSDPHPHYLDPNSSPPHVGGGSRLPPPPLLPPPPFPPLPLPPRSPYHHPLSPPLPFMSLPPPDANLYPSSVDGHRPPPLGRMSSPPPAPSPSQSPHLPPNDSRGGEFPSPYRDRGGGGRSSSPSGLYMPPDDRGLGEDWRMGRYCTPPPHPSHSSDFPIPPYPPRPHWGDEPPHPSSSFRPLPSQRTEGNRELKGSRSKGNHTSESDVLDKSSRHGGKL